jgi:hypothetical protein
MARIAVVIAFCVLVISCLIQPAGAAVLAYEGFDYENTGPSALAGQSGGTGWTDGWFDTTGLNNAGQYTVSQDDTSLTSTAFPFTAIGDHAISASGIGTARIFRMLSTTFDTSVDGKLFGSFLIRKDGSASTGSDNFEINLMPGLTTTADPTVVTSRVGIGSSENPFIGVGNSTSVATGTNTLDLGTTYFMVFKIEAFAAATDTLSLKVYAPGDTVPVSEPSWDLSGNLAASSQAVSINGIRISKAINASGVIDEIRIGQTWADVTVPAVVFQPGDFDENGLVDGDDFAIWQMNFPKSTDAEWGDGDADGDADVDGADFVVWQTNFPFPSPSVSSIPEPMSFILAGFGLIVLLLAKSKGRSPWACAR